MDCMAIGGVLVMPVHDGSFEVNCFWDRINLLKNPTVRRIWKIVYIIVSILLAGLLVGLDFAMKAFVRRVIEPLQGESVRAVSTIGDLEGKVEEVNEKLDKLGDRLGAKDELIADKDDAILLLEETAEENARLKQEDEEQLDALRGELSQVRENFARSERRIERKKGIIAELKRLRDSNVKRYKDSREENRLLHNGLGQSIDALQVQETEIKTLRKENLKTSTDKKDLLEKLAKEREAFNLALEKNEKPSDEMEIFIET